MIEQIACTDMLCKSRGFFPLTPSPLSATYQGADSDSEPLTSDVGDLQARTLRISSQVS